MIKKIKLIELIIKLLNKIRQMFLMNNLNIKLFKVNIKIKMHLVGFHQQLQATMIFINKQITLKIITNKKIKIKRKCKLIVLQSNNRIHHHQNKIHK